MAFDFDITYVMDYRLQSLCLFKNAKDAIVDLVQYYYSREYVTSNIKEVLQKLKILVLGIYPRTFVFDNSKLSEIRKSIDVLKSSNYFNELDLTEVIDCVILLGLFNGCSDTDELVKVNADLRRDQDFQDIDNWTTFWKYNVAIIVKVLSFLKSKNVLDDRLYFQRCLEVETILMQESRDMLYRIYADEIKHHYNITTPLSLVDKFYRRCSHLMRFQLQFSLPKLKSKENTSLSYWFSLKESKHSYMDFGLTTEMSRRIDRSVSNMFRDHLGECNSERYSVCLCRVDNEQVKIRGKCENEAAYFRMRFYPPAGAILPDYYDSGQEYNSSETKYFLDKISEIFESVVEKNMGMRVSFGLTSWRFSHSVLKSDCFITKKRPMVSMTLDEMYKMDKSVEEAIEKFNSTFNDIKIGSMTPYYTRTTGNLNYCFQVRIHSLGLLETIQNLIPHVQSVIMDIDDY